MLLDGRRDQADRAAGRRRSCLSRGTCLAVTLVLAAVSPAVTPFRRIRHERELRHLPPRSEFPGPGPARTGSHPHHAAGRTHPYRVDAPWAGSIAA